MQRHRLTEQGRCLGDDGFCHVQWCKTSLHSHSGRCILWSGRTRATGVSGWWALPCCRLVVQNILSQCNLGLCAGTIFPPIHLSTHLTANSCYLDIRISGYQNCLLYSSIVCHMCGWDVDMKSCQYGFLHLSLAHVQTRTRPSVKCGGRPVIVGMKQLASCTHTLLNCLFMSKVSLLHWGWGLTVERKQINKPEMWLFHHLFWGRSHCCVL